MSNTLRQHLTELCAKWKALPSGTTFDNGFCQSELLASDVTDILVKHPDEGRANDDQVLADQVRAKIAFYGSGLDDYCVEELRNSLESRGFDIAIKTSAEPEGLIQKLKKKLSP